MTDKPPAYENQWPAGYGMQSEQPSAAGWTTGAPPPQQQQQGNPPPQFQQPQPQFQQQQYQPTGTQQIIRKLYIIHMSIFKGYLAAHHMFNKFPIPKSDQVPFMKKKQ